jgi:hypothetical protein
MRRTALVTHARPLLILLCASTQFNPTQPRVHGQQGFVSEHSKEHHEAPRSACAYHSHPGGDARQKLAFCSVSNCDALQAAFLAVQQLQSAWLKALATSQPRLCTRSADGPTRHACFARFAQELGSNADEGFITFRVKRRIRDPGTSNPVEVGTCVWPPLGRRDCLLEPVSRHGAQRRTAVTDLQQDPCMSQRVACG